MRSRILGTVTEAISLEEARAQCYVDTEVTSDVNAQDIMIPIYLAGARAMAENFTGLAFCKKTIELARDAFPEDSNSIELTAPATTVVSVKYYDGDGTLQTMDPDYYFLDMYSRPSWLTLVDGYEWPTVAERANAVIITYETGFGDDTDSEIIPPEAKIAILLTVGKLFEERSDATEKPTTQLPEGALELLRPLRVKLGMA